MAGNVTTQEKGRLAPFIISVVLLIAWCVVIVLFSAGTGDESQSLSDGVIARLIAFLQPGFASLTEAQQDEIIATWSFPIRKLAHFSEFFALSGLAVNALYRARTVFGKLSGMSAVAICGIAVAFSALYACGDEFHQLFVDGRAGKLFDVGVDTAGAIAFCILFAAVRRASKARKASSK